MKKLIWCVNISWKHYFFDFDARCFDQEEEFENALKGGETFPLEQFTKLNDIHHKNYDVLMQYLNDYQPQAFGKSYANDPDYKDLQRQFFDMDKTNGSAARSEATPKLKVLKVKKKPKKISSNL